jgi:hypothetical protein
MCGSTGEVNEEATDAEMRGENNEEGEPAIDPFAHSPTLAFTLATRNHHLSTNLEAMSRGVSSGQRSRPLAALSP